jgi:hypothetical protein
MERAAACVEQREPLSQPDPPAGSVDPRKIIERLLGQQERKSPAPPKSCEMSDKERKTRAEAHYRAAARYMKEDVNHPRAKAHMMRWGALRFGDSDVDPRLERYATMLRKYKEFSVYASDDEGMLGNGMLFPNRFRDNNEEKHGEYRRGLNGSKVKLEHLVRR